VINITKQEMTENMERCLREVYKFLLEYEPPKKEKEERENKNAA
jgi:hypothetical protein